jgi:hypothetical protein
MCDAPSRLLLAMILAFAGAVDTWALGIGQATRMPVIGAPLRIEIPLQLGEGELPPQAGCVRIQALEASADAQFYPHDARVLVESRARPRIFVVASRGVAEPIVEFRLSVGCSDVVVRDFLLLADAPSPATPAVKAAPADAVSAGGTIPRATPLVAVPPRAVTSARTEMLSEPTTLNAIARQRYPFDRRKRDEYRQLMAAANPDVFAVVRNPGAVSLRSGIELRIPDGLPSVDPKPAGEPRQPAKNDSPRAAARDRLVIGGGGLSDQKYLASGEALASVKRMEGMLEEQKQIEARIDQSLRTANEVLADTRRRFTEIEAAQERHTRGLRDTQLRMEAADRKLAQSLGLWDLLLVVMASGTTGAGLLILHDRLAGGRRPAIGSHSEEAEQHSRPRKSAPRAPEPPRVAQPSVATAPTEPPKPVSGQPAVTKPSAVPQAIKAEAPIPARATMSEAKRPPPPTTPAPAPLMSAPVAAPVKGPETLPPSPVKSALAAKPRRQAAKDELLPTALAASLGLDGSRAEEINRLLPEFPSFDVCAWFAAFDYLRANDERKAFASLALQLNEQLNVELPAWDRDVNAGLSSLLDFPRITDFLQTLWRTNDPSLTRAFLVDLLNDNRGGTRNGFTEGAATDIAVLIGIIDIDAGT